MRRLILFFAGLFLIGCEPNVTKNYERNNLKQSSGSTNLLLQKKIEKKEDITIGLVCINGGEYAFMKIGYSERGGVGLEKTENECETQTKRDTN